MLTWHHELVVTYGAIKGRASVYLFLFMSLVVDGPFICNDEVYFG